MQRLLIQRDVCQSSWHLRKNWLPNLSFPVFPTLLVMKKFNISGSYPLRKHATEVQNSNRDSHTWSRMLEIRDIGEDQIGWHIRALFCIQGSMAFSSSSAIRFRYAGEEFFCISNLWKLLIKTKLDLAAWKEIEQRQMKLGDIPDEIT